MPAHVSWLFVSSISPSLNFSPHLNKWFPWDQPLSWTPILLSLLNNYALFVWKRIVLHGSSTWLVKYSRLLKNDFNCLFWYPCPKLHFVGALLNGRSTSSSGSLVDSDQLDGGLIAGVLRLLQFGDVCLKLILQLLQQDAQLSSPNVASVLIHISSGAIIRLELAIITFLERFRKIYIGDNISRATKVWWLHPALIL